MVSWITSHLTNSSALSSREFRTPRREAAAGTVGKTNFKRDPAFQVDKLDADPNFGLSTLRGWHSPGAGG